MVGVLKGYDQLLNLVLDEAVEYLRGEAAGQQGAGCARAGWRQQQQVRRSEAGLQPWKRAARSTPAADPYQQLLNSVHHLPLLPPPLLPPQIPRTPCA